ncbi:MAG: DUF302 domain-containing protein [Deinococcales bacterium]
MNLVERWELEQVTQLQICNLGFAEIFFNDSPAIAIWAPCRLYLYMEGDTVRVGSTSLGGIAPLYPHLAEETREAMQEVYDIIVNSVKELGAENFDFGPEISP